VNERCPDNSWQIVRCRDATGNEMPLAGLAVRSNSLRARAISYGNTVPACSYPERKLAQDSFGGMSSMRRQI